MMVTVTPIAYLERSPSAAGVFFAGGVASRAVDGIMHR